MKNTIQPPRGTRDYTGTDARLLAHIMATAAEVAQRYGYAPVVTPVFEFSEVFHRSLGDTSDVVSKETYTFTDRGGESLTLRPECTAPVVRAFISGGFMQQLPFRAFYAGAAFRYERPQKGRQRQFHQVGVECLGANAPWHDAESIACARDVLAAVLGEDALAQVTLELNTLGDAESRAAHRSALVAYLERYRDDLSPESQVRLEKNPLRILDSKQEADRAIVAEAPTLDAYLNDASRAWIDGVVEALGVLGIAYTLSPRLVRGLDYYTHTVFEFTTTHLGAQATVLAGGRYNGLVAQLGGQDIAGIGWAAGVERLMLLCEHFGRLDAAAAPPPVVCVALGEVAIPLALECAAAVRAAGLCCEILSAKHLGKALSKADNMGVRWCVLIGESEAASGQVRLKDLRDGGEEMMGCEALRAWCAQPTGKTG